ncbi:ABC transporter substrate-binding protein [Caenispirillum bisanense]|uniref:Amino acid/amide ABC transporter substrate-binding protein, HAAT family n=1 Tax=Caenispirillum bisanense TaxID=414052 RepID=A0A286GWV7_9PROT|nr:ABC transporter substrate-binding protein [Caenispirillum bisanense]SOD99569.1 amino acid/amide ABC transporter substrate-binding protein, HAAT family [Caenispirillum bisanense]
MTLNTILRRVAAGIVFSAVAYGGAAQAETFTLGSQVPLTGNLARVGTGMHEGISVAIAMANKELGGKHEFKVSTIDDESNPAKAVAAVEKLASEGVVALTGGYGSNIIGPASEAAAKSDLVYITSGGVAPELTHRDLDTFFRINNSEGYGKAMLGLLKDMGVKKVSVIYSNKEATDAMAKYVEEGLKEAGVEVTTHEFDASTTDFKSIMNKVKLRDRSDAIAMIGYENDYVGILRAASVLKPEAKAIVGVWSLATSQMNTEFHDLVQNVYGTSLLPYPVKFSGDEAVEFSATYKEMFGKEPDYLGQFGYVQTRLLIDAVVAAADKGEVSGKTVAQELRSLKADTLIGDVAFDENGDNPNFSHRMGQHQGDRVEIVWPEKAATAKMNFPAVPW